MTNAYDNVPVELIPYIKYDIQRQKTTYRGELDDRDIRACLDTRRLVHFIANEIMATIEKRVSKVLLPAIDEAIIKTLEPLGENIDIALDNILLPPLEDNHADNQTY